ncbi:xanthine dehydrogenase family protein subunit M [Candidatus Bipolaricaulota bacterium]|nr:xanthine dehydrogenase family protein subunit M [Candidatus Bipolaricaulota bacterium]
MSGEKEFVQHLQHLKIGSIEDLLQQIGEPGARIICGGTDLLVKMRSGAISPERLLDISEIDALRAIEEKDGRIEIGAAVTESEILASELVTVCLPLLRTALVHLGSLQIRNRGTLGGNLVNASPAADSAVPLLLYNAELILQRAGSERSIPVEEFFRGPGQTALASGEFLRTVSIPIPREGFDPFFHKVGRRRALAIAIASLGALLWVEGGVVAEARLAAGSVAPTAIRLSRTENLLTGEKITPELIAQARELAAQEVSPITDIRASAGYRREVIGDLVERFLNEVVG